MPHETPCRVNDARMGCSTDRAEGDEEESRRRERVAEQRDREREADHVRARHSPSTSVPWQYPESEYLITSASIISFSTPATMAFSMICPAQRCCNMLQHGTTGRWAGGAERSNNLAARHRHGQRGWAGLLEAPEQRVDPLRRVIAMVNLEHRCAVIRRPVRSRARRAEPKHVGGPEVCGAVAAKVAHRH